MNEREALIQFCKELDMATQKLHLATYQLLQNLQSVEQNPEPKPIENKSKVADKLAKIHWEKRKNKAGEDFEIAEAKKNEGNSDYEQLVNTLIGDSESGKKGRVHDGLWYWLFPEGDAVGRKAVKEKPRK